MRRSRSSRLPACGSPPSADLAGRTVALSTDIPPSFDPPNAPALATHHKLFARWVAGRAEVEQHFTRVEARRHIERTFDAAVMEILRPVNLAELRVAVLIGEANMPPAIVVICDSVGQLDLRWIEKSNVLSDTLFGSVAPVAWRATAYAALEETLKTVLPVFGFDDMMECLSGYYWDGETTDVAARQSLMDYHGYGPEDMGAMTLPSQVMERRPDYMLASNATALKTLPAGLRKRVRALRAAHTAVRAMRDASPESSGWFFDWDMIREYLPHLEDAGDLPPLTLVPFDQFAQELDDVCRHSMETCFIDVAGLCQLNDPAKIDAWLASLKLGVDLLVAAQALIDIDPTEMM